MNKRSEIILTGNELKTFRKALMTWYHENRRDLPWRNTEDPYAIWISEIMLQQTRVDQVLPYYERFMARFPSIEELNRAPLEEILKLWEGLGYYARARHIKRAAGQIVTKYGGKMPDESKQISKLPGIGSYTTAAIMSIALGHDCPVIDGNVVRVLSRIFYITETPTSSAIKERIAAIAEFLLVKGQAGDFNQAMMELGAMICTPRKPSCAVCPVHSLCLAQASLPDPSVLPYKKPRKKRNHHHVVTGIVRRGDKLLIVRRPLEGLLGGLWEFPGATINAGGSRERFLVKKMYDDWGIEIRVDGALATIKHAFTHFKMTLHGYHCTYMRCTALHQNRTDCRWIRMDDLANYAFPRAHIRLIEAMAQDTENQ